MEYRKIGSISGTHGLDGQLNLHIEEVYSGFLKKDAFVFIELRSRTYIPYKVVAVRKANQEFYIASFKGFDNVDESKAITGKSLYLPVSLLGKIQQKLAPGYLSSFSIKDTHTGFQAKIEQVFESAGQMLAILKHENKEIIIPINEHFIEDIDEKENIIFLNIPEGLLDIYLG